MKPHVLVIPSHLDCKWSAGGTFFTEQAVIMRRVAGWKINILMPCARHWAKIKRRDLPLVRGIEKQHTDGVEIWFGYFPYFLPRKTRSAWRYFGEEMFLRYAEIHGVPDMIWSQGIINSGYLARHLRKKHGVPYFVHEHVRMYAREKMSRLLVARIRGVIGDSIYCAAVSENLLLAMRRQNAATVDKMAVIHNPVGFEFAASPIFRIPRVDFIFATISGLLPNKRVDSVICAFAEIHRDNSNTRLIVAGDGVERQKLETLARSLRIKEFVSFVGWQNRMQVRDLLSGADAFVTASEYENCSVALIEALACGIPAATTRVGIAEKIINHSNGSLADSPAPKDIASAMRVVLSSNYCRARIRTCAMEQFHPRVFARRIEEMLK